MNYKREYNIEKYGYSSRNASSFAYVLSAFAGSGLLYSILALISLAIIPVPFSLIPACWFISKALSLLFDVIDYLFFHTFRPLTKLREWLTNTGYNSPYVTLLEGKRGPKKRVRYYTIPAFLRYGVIGNLIFWVPVLFATITLISYRPYGDGYVLKQLEYQTGDSVIVAQKSKNIQSIITGYDTEEYTIETGDIISKDDIKGIYIEDDKSRFQQVIASDIHNVKYLSEKISLFVEELKE